MFVFISRSHEKPPHPGMESIFFEPRLFVCSRMLLLPWGAREEIFSVVMYFCLTSQGLCRFLTSRNDGSKVSASDIYEAIQRSAIPHSMRYVVSTLYA